MIVLLITLVALILLLTIWFIPIDKTSPKKEDEKPILKKGTPNILGESHFKLRHKMTTDDTTQKADCQDKKDDTFVSSEVFVEDNLPLDIDFPLEKEEEMTEEDLAEEEEELESLFGKDAELATGVDFEDLFTTKEVIEDKDSSLEREQQAGKVLYENQHTVLFEELVSKQKSTGVRIASLVDIHLALLDEGNNSNQTATTQTSDEYKNFNINDFIN